MPTLLAHEWLAPTGGSENVFEQLTKAINPSRRVCLWNASPSRFGTSIEETWLARTPLRRSKAMALPFMPKAWKSVDLTGVDRTVVSSHAFAHHLASKSADRGIASFAYVHTPARYIWASEFDHRGDSRLGRAGRGYFQRLDRSTATNRVTYAANSSFVRDRIKLAWGVEATVIHPPVDVLRIQSQGSWVDTVSTPKESDNLSRLPNEFVLGASRLVEYKRLDEAIRVGELLQIPVVIAGSGPDLARLEERARQSSVPVTFFGYASDEALFALYQLASLFVFMAIEDFGIMPVEAIALGTPVIVNSVGGSSEAVRQVSGGAWADPDEPDQSLKVAATRALETDMRGPLARVSNFSHKAFYEQIVEWID